MKLGHSILRQVPAVEILRVTWIHQYYVENDRVRLRAATDLPPTGSRMDSPYDRDARYGNKRSVTWTGYKVHCYSNPVYPRLRAERIEPPTPEQVERLIHSATHSFEKNFCTATLAQLSEETIAKIDALLNTDGAIVDEQVQLKPSDFNNLKTDPGRTSLDTIIKEFDKLQCIRNLALPTNLFTGVSPKVLQQYRQRASVEPPRELRRHPDPIRYTSDGCCNS
jgi:hypothetical protein